MKFKPGDTVIKITGGNKMKIIEYTPKGVNCAWISESYKEDTFNEEDLVSISDYSSILVNCKRDDRIQEILKNF